jgi:hypothetical protein
MPTLPGGSRALPVSTWREWKQNRGGIASGGIVWSDGERTRPRVPCPAPSRDTPLQTGAAAFFKMTLRVRGTGLRRGRQRLHATARALPIFQTGPPENCEVFRRPSGADACGGGVPVVPLCFTTGYNSAKPPAFREGTAPSVPGRGSDGALPSTISLRRPAGADACGGGVPVVSLCFTTG